MIRTTARLVAAAIAATAALAAAAGTAAAAPDRPGVADGNTWLLRNSLSGGNATTRFVYGSAQDHQHVTGDWDGNGTRTPGIVRAVGGNYFWYLRNSNSGGPTDVTPFSYGRSQPGASTYDVPVVGDWDGDGKDGIGVVRQAATGAPRWLLRNPTTGGAAQHDFGYGTPADYSFVVGDWDGNGTDTPGLVRRSYPARPTWLLRNANSSGGAQLQFPYGSANEPEIAVAGDWDGDGKDGIGVLRYSAGRYVWLLRDTPDAGNARHQFTYGTWGTNPTIWS
jgi:hypothetical protein